MTRERTAIGVETGNVVALWDATARRVGQREKAEGHRINEMIVLRLVGTKKKSRLG